MKDTIILFIFSCVLFSCSTKSQLIYLKDVDDNYISKINRFKQKTFFQPGDILKIDVSSIVPEAAIPYNSITQNSNKIVSQNIEMLKPDILMESESHNIDQIMEGERLVKAYGGKVIVMPYLKEQSSTSIKEQIKGYQK